MVDCCVMVEVKRAEELELELKLELLSTGVSAAAVDSTAEELGV